MSLDPRILDPPPNMQLVRSAQVSTLVILLLVLRISYLDDVGTDHFRSIVALVGSTVPTMLVSFADLAKAVRECFAFVKLSDLFDHTL